MNISITKPLPIYKQVLLYSEALCPSIAIEAVIVSPDLRFAIITLASALWKLCQFILGGTEWPGLLSDTRSVNDQTVLWRENREEKRFQQKSLLQNMQHLLNPSSISNIHYKVVRIILPIYCTIIVKLTLPFTISMSMSAFLAHLSQKFGSSREMSVRFPDATKLAWEQT